MSAGEEPDTLDEMREIPDDSDEQEAQPKDVPKPQTEPAAMTKQENDGTDWLTVVPRRRRSYVRNMIALGRDDVSLGGEAPFGTGASI